MKNQLAQFSVQLRHHREACKLSQQELAERIKIGYRTYQRFESGETTPSLDIIFQLAKELDFKLHEIFLPDNRIEKILQLKVFNEENEHEFLNDPQVYGSKLLELSKIDITNGIEAITQNPLFKNSTYYLGVTTFRNVNLNNAVRDKLGFKSNVISTPAATEYVREQGILWAYMMANGNKYAIEKRTYKYPAGVATLTLKRVLIEQNDVYAMITVCDVQI